MLFLRYTLLLSFFIFGVKCFSTNYEYYTSGGVRSGLSVDQSYFLLNGKNISVYSGSIHYFRVPRVYWRDRLQKLKALGFNTVETYVAWNLHEPQPGYYDFGDGGSDLQDFLHLEEFIKLAQEEDLFMIIRPGPFICAEFEFGGFPSWLLRDKDLEVRSSNKIYMKYVSRWFNVLMPILAKHQFLKGGPIIALQVENEFALYKSGQDKTYLTELRQLMLDNGIVELLVTSDNPWRGDAGTIKEYFFLTGNFNTEGKKNLDLLTALQPKKPVMVMEFWSGWFDYWGKRHQTTALEAFRDTYETILSYPASANIYMFIGGTNFGFLSGAQNLNSDDLNSKFSPITTSYDYGALLAENGDYTDKYHAAKELLAKYNPNPNITLPAVPKLIPRVSYPKILITDTIDFTLLLSSLPNEERSNLVSMEHLVLNNNSGQSYGYIIYSKSNLTLPANSILKIVGRVCDTVIVLVNGEIVSPILEKSANLGNFGTWVTENSTLTLNTKDLANVTLDLIVENWGRINVGRYKQFKGLWQGNVEINNQPIYNWKHSSLEFKKSWLNRLTQWKIGEQIKGDLKKPTLFKALLKISDAPKDTYINMEYWTKGIVIVNGMVLGRYSKMGPQQALYLPAPFLQQGNNVLMIFEHFRSPGEIEFVKDQIYKVY